MSCDRKVSVEEPLGNVEARQLIRRILSGGTVRFTTHAWEEMENDHLLEVHCRQVLKRGVVESSDFERGTWRYRVRVPGIVVVVAFRSEQMLVVVTAWRTNR